MCFVQCEKINRSKCTGKVLNRAQRAWKLLPLLSQVVQRCNLGQKVLSILNSITLRTPIPLWPLLFFCPHPSQSCLVGFRNDPDRLQRCVFFFKGGGGGRTRGSICSCQRFQEFYLESRQGNVHLSQHFSTRLWVEITQSWCKIWTQLWKRKKTNSV